MKLILKDDKMATQKILKLVIIAIISTSMANNMQASLIEPTITTTIVSQSPHQIPQMLELFATDEEDSAFLFDSIRYLANFRQQNERYSVMPQDFRAFTYGMNGNWNLLELCLYGETMSELIFIQTNIAESDKLSYIPLTEGSLHEDRFEYAQITTDGWFGIEPDIFYDWEAICEYGIIPLSIQSSLNDIVFSGTELDELYEWEFVSWPFCYINDFYYNLSTFFENSDRIVVTYISEPNISPSTVPEPATLVLLSFGTLVFVRKRK